jgi:hypothetical protein
LDAIECLNGKLLFPSFELPLSVELFNEETCFRGCAKNGLDKALLMSNSHFRVLFLKGIDF